MFSHQKIFTTRTLTGLLALLATILLNACGGAASDVTASASSITYSGLTTQAVLSADNDDAFGLAMLEGGADGGKALGTVPLSVTTDNTTSQSTAKNQLSALDTLIQQIIANTHQGQGASANLQAQVFDTGTCGGTIDVTGTASGGSITFNNYCMTVTFNGQTITTTINGSVNYSLTGDIQSGTYEIVYHYSGMTITIDDGTTTTSHYFSGTITYSVNNWSSITVTYSTSFERDGKIYQLENPTIGTGTTSITISGRLYHPDYGYVDITTDSPFSQSSSGQYCDGTLSITAKNSSGITVSSTMIINPDCTSYTIEYNNDGNIETIQWP